MTLKKLSTILAAALLAVSCGGGNTPETPTPTPVKPTPSDPDPVVEKNRYYFTQAYVGLFAGETAETELRLQGKKYDLNGNADGITFSSANPAVATVDASGKITGVAVGHTTVTATDKNKASAEICVRVYPEGFLKYQSPAGDEVPIFAWFAEISTTLQFNTLRQCGFNMAYIPWTNGMNYQSLLDNAKTSKVKLILAGLDPQTYKDHAGLGMYMITDEPSTDKTTLEGLKNNMMYYSSVDKNHYCYINFSAHDSDEFEKTFDILPLNFLSYDHYPIRKSELRAEYYLEMSEARKAANIMAVPFWAFTNSTEHKDYPTPTIEHLRFQLFADIVYGAQAFQFFTYTVPGGDPQGIHYEVGPLDKNLQPTQIWNDCQTVISEIKNYMRFLNGAQNIWIIGNVDSSLGTYDQKDLPFPLTEVKSSGQYIISHSVNAGHEYLLVFNSNYKSSNTINLKFSQSVERIGDAGSLTSVSGSVAVSLSPGNIAVFKLN